MKLCEWCERPISEDAELCPDCLEAQKRVASGNIIPAPKERESVAAILARGTLMLMKAAAAGALGTLMVVAALIGTCSGILALVSTGPAHVPMMFGYSLLASIAFLIAYLLAKQIRSMYPNNLLERKKKHPATPVSPPALPPAPLPDSELPDDNET